MLLALCALLASPPAQAALPAPRGGATFGLGIGGGIGVSGLSGKYWIDHRNALQGVIGTYGVGRYPYYWDGHGYYSGFGVSLDYLFEMPDIADTGAVVFGWNLGLGGSLGVGPGTWLGAAGVLGLEADFQPIPIDIVLEYRPGVLLVPGVGADLWNFTGQLRFYFT